MKKFEFIGDRRRIFIQELLASWHKTLVMYEKELARFDDLPYWYIERTNIGILAAAAFNIGAFPIEEYRNYKRRGANRHSGRADLLITLANGTTLDIEAKQKYISLNSKEVAKSTRALLTSAVKDTKALSMKSHVAIGIAFVIPYISKTREIDLMPFRDQILEIEKNSGDFAAIHFCDEELLPRRSQVNEIYPGIAIVGKYG